MAKLTCTLNASRNWGVVMGRFREILSAGDKLSNRTLPAVILGFKIPKLDKKEWFILNDKNKQKIAEFW